MNPQPPYELRPSERPVRSDYAQEKAYARRRVLTLFVLGLILCGAVYAIWGRGPSLPKEIPTIKSEGAYKQKPADPGGIDIPHQDVRVYDELESKNAPQAPVEHLLPPPEIPVPHAVESAPAPETTVAPTVAKQPETVSATPTSGDAILSDTRPAKILPTTVAPAPNSAPLPAVVTPAVTTPLPVATVATAPAPQAPKSKTLSIEQVIESTKTSAPVAATPTTATKPAAVSGTMVVVQLASVPDEAQAQSLMKNLQQKYAPQLGDAVLRLTRADLGSRGIYYRIQSQSLGADEANQICSSLKQINAGCILVRK